VDELEVVVVHVEPRELRRGRPAKRSPPCSMKSSTAIASRAKPARPRGVAYTPGARRRRAASSATSAWRGARERNMAPHPRLNGERSMARPDPNACQCDASGKLTWGVL